MDYSGTVQNYRIPNVSLELEFDTFGLRVLDSVDYSFYRICFM